MKRTFRFTALLLVILLVFPMAANAAASAPIQLKEHWFTDDNTLYNHSMAQASMFLSAQGIPALQSGILSGAGFSDVTICTGETYGQLNLLDYTVASATVGGRTVTLVVFHDPTVASDGSDDENKKVLLEKQLQSIADFDGRNHGFTAGKNKEVPVLLCSALAALDTLNPTEDSCVWVTGFGYGGGAAELLAALLNGQTMTLEGTAHAYTGPAVDVRAYTFGAPAVSTAAAGDHRNIFVITNPEDLMTYLPGSGWGYGHFGREIVLDTFYGKPAASVSMRTAVADTYKSLTGKDYYTFSSNDYQTGDTTAAIATYICSDIAPTLDAYYNTAHKAKAFPNLDTLTILKGDRGTKTVSYTTYALISDALSVLSGAESDSFVCLAVATYLYGTTTPFYPIISFLFEHALHLSFTTSTIFSALPDLLALKSAVDNGESIATYEMVCAHSPTTYLAWMTAAPAPDSLSAHAAKQIYWLDLTVSGSTVTCSSNLPADQTLWLAVYGNNGQMLTAKPLNSGVVYDTQTVSRAGYAKLFRLGAGYAPSAPVSTSK